jgi:hypothetical protein
LRALNGTSSDCYTFVRDVETRLASEQRYQELRVTTDIVDLKQFIQTQFGDMKEDIAEIKKKMKSSEEKSTKFYYFSLVFAFLVLSEIPAIKDGFNFIVNLLKIVP